MSEQLGPFLQNTFGDVYLPVVNGHAFDRLGAETFFADHFGATFDDKNTLYVILGTDSGLLVRHLNRKKLPRGSRFLFVELPEVLLRLTEEQPFPELQPCMTIITPDLLVQQLAEFHVEDYTYLGNLFMVESVAAADLHLPDYSELHVQVSQELEMLAWQIKAALGNKSFTEKQLTNLGENIQGIHLLDGAFDGWTAVVVGGGPSLDEIIPWIRQHRDRIVLLAVSRTSRRLIEAGLAPDLIFNIDPQAVSYVVSRDALKLHDQSVLVHYYHAASELVGQWRGPHFYAGPRFPWKTPLNDDDFRFPGPTVTHMAIDAALRLGCRQIVLGGVDLCFSREGHSHARGNTERDTGRPIVEPVKVETNGGWLAETTVPYAMGVAAIETLAARAVEKGAQVINPAPGAAKMKGVLHVPVEQVVLQAQPQPARTLVRTQVSEETGEMRQQHLQTMLAELQRVDGQLQEMMRLSADALTANAGLFGRKGKRRDFSYKHQMDAIETKLNDRYGSLATLVKNYAADRFLELVSPEREQHGWTDDDIEEVGNIYYRAMQAGCQQLRDLIKTAVERLAIRLEEESAQPNWDRLTRFWLQENTPGRLLLWQDRHPAVPAPTPTVQALWRKLLDRHRDLQETGGDLVPGYLPPDALTRVRELVANAAQRVHLLFRRQDRIGLENLARRLEGPEPERVPMQKITEAYLLELGGRKDEALALYESLIDESDPYGLLENLLRRIASLTLEKHDFDNALLALQCLTDLSIIYAPQYADLLRVCGQVQEAIAVYERYVERCPRDLTALLRMASLHEAVGNREGARIIVNYVLEQQPDHSAAQAMAARLPAAAQPSPQ